MSLRVFLNEKDIDKSLVYIYNNDTFFSAFTGLKDTSLVSDILKTIDEATRVSDLIFAGRTVEMGNSNKSLLSTGTKTLLNILQHPDKCFSVVECGNNALQFIPKITEGYIYWQYPALWYTEDGVCDIDCNDMHFSNFYDFLQYTLVVERGVC